MLLGYKFKSLFQKCMFYECDLTCDNELSSSSSSNPLILCYFNTKNNINHKSMLKFNIQWLSHVYQINN